MAMILGEIAAKTVEAVGEVAKKTGELAARATELGQEVNEAALNELGIKGTAVVAPDMAVIKESSLKSVMLNNIERTSRGITDVKLGTNFEKIHHINGISPLKEISDAAEVSERTSVERISLTEADRAKIIEETGWSKEIVDYIENMDQYEVYKNAGLHEEEINGRKCLVKNIDMDYVDPKTGLTNRERIMIKNRVPIDAKTGERIELHHMGQNFDSPFAELAENSEHGDGKHAILHDNKVESWRQDPEKKNHYNVQRANHWRARAGEV